MTDSRGCQFHTDAPNQHCEGCRSLQRALDQRPEREAVPVEGQERVHFSMTPIDPAKVFSTEDGTTEFSFILQPSLIHGVGVFATHDIKAGTRLRLFPASDTVRYLPSVPPLFDRYVVSVDAPQVMCPADFGRMSVGWYLNDSRNPNVLIVGNYEYEAARAIKEGEELTIDYTKLEPAEAVVEKMEGEPNQESVNQSQNLRDDVGMSVVPHEFDPIHADSDECECGYLKDSEIHQSQVPSAVPDESERQLTGCPFCGCRFFKGKFEFMGTTVTNKIFSYRCPKCRAQFGIEAKDEAAAVTVWNTRVSVPEQQMRQVIIEKVKARQEKFNGFGGLGIGGAVGRKLCDELIAEIESISLPDPPLTPKEKK